MSDTKFDVVLAYLKQRLAVMRSLAEPTEDTTPRRVVWYDAKVDELKLLIAKFNEMSADGSMNSSAPPPPYERASSTKLIN